MHIIYKELVDKINQDNVKYVITYDGGCGALYASIKKGNYELTKLLLENGAVINEGLGFFLLHACRHNHDDIVQLLLDNNIKYGKKYELLITACMINDNTNNLILLTQCGIIQNLEIYFVNRITHILEQCLRRKTPNILQFIIDKYPELVLNNIDCTLVKEIDIHKYKFLKMLIDRNIIDIAD